jgi:ADP-ribose pyrophosphatase
MSIDKPTKREFKIQFDDRPYHNGFVKVYGADVAHATYKGDMVACQRELVRKGDSVSVVVIDPKYSDKYASVLLVEQFRIGAHRQENPWTLEFPAGMIDEGETPQQTASRELLEECGLVVAPDSIEHLHSYYPSVGTCDELQHLMICTASLQGVDGRTGGHGGDEDVKCFVAPLELLVPMVLAGRINTAGTIVGVLSTMYSVLLRATERQQTRPNLILPKGMVH